MTDGFNWYALYVRSRHEFVTREDLHRKNIENFLPSFYRISQWKDRKKEIEFPLFPGYLFVCIRPRPEEIINVLRSRGAVNLLCSEPGNPVPVPEEEINSLVVLIESGQKLDIFPHLKEGARVRIKRGPLKGAIGVLKSKEDQPIFVVNIDILGRSVAVKIYADDIEGD